MVRAATASGKILAVPRTNVRSLLPIEIRMPPLTQATRDRSDRMQRIAGRHGRVSAAQSRRTKTTRERTRTTNQSRATVRCVMSMEDVQYGSYRALGILGQGGMGEVYRARHVSSLQVVALKTARGTDPQWAQAITREVQALARIRHPGVVRLLDHGVQDGVPWYAMDLLEGENLRDYIKRVWSTRSYGEGLADSAAPYLPTTEPVTDRGGLSAEFDEVSIEPAVRPTEEHLPRAAAGGLHATLRLIQELCSTLAFLHGEGLINCDLKPENIVLRDQRPVILDFGLAALPHQLGREAISAPQTRLGTVPYMSPEQISGDQADARSDLYAVGCLLYELLVGKPPFCGPPRLVLLQHLSSRPIPPSTLASDVSPELEAIVLRLLEKQPSQRFAYADEVVRALTKLAPNLPQVDTAIKSYLYRPRHAGRDQLVSEVTDLRDRALGGRRGAFVILRGESGVGKTRFAMELARVEGISRMLLVSSESAPVNLEDGAPIAVPPLHGVRPLLRAIATRCTQGGPKVAERLLGNRQSVLSVYEPLLNMVETARRPSTPPNLPPDAARKRLFRYLAESLRALAHEVPLFWILDDLGWADELSLAFLSTLDETFFAACPCFLLATSRSEEVCEGVDVLRSKAHVHDFTLSRLSDHAVSTMVGDMLAVATPQAPLVSFVINQTEGNPFFVTEYLRNAVSERALFRDGLGFWRFSGALDELSKTALPTSLRDLIQRRLSALTPHARKALLAAAVIGRSCEVDLLAEVLAATGSNLEVALEELVRRQILERAGATVLRFAHDKLREAAYGAAAEDSLTGLHGGVARALEARLESALDRNKLWVTIGHHFVAARQAAPASYYLRIAADHARATFANAEAIALYEKARYQSQQCFDGSPAARAQLVQLEEALSDVLTLVGQRDEARRIYQQVLEHGVPDPGITARVNRKIGKTWEAEHRHEQALLCYQRAEKALPATVTSAPEHLEEWMQVRIAQLWVFYFSGKQAEMESLSRDLEPVIERHSSPVLRSRFFHTQWMRTLRRERYAAEAETLGFARSALEASMVSGDFSLVMADTFALGFVLHFAHQHEASLEQLERSLTMAEEGGDAVQQARSLTYLSIASRMLGRVHETKDYTERAAQKSRACGLQDYVAAALANQCWLRVKAQELTLASSLAHEALDLWRVTIAYPFQWLALVPLLRIALIEENVAQAVSWAKALLAPTQQVLPSRASTALSDALDAYHADTDRSRTLLELTRVVQILEESGHG